MSRKMTKFSTQLKTRLVLEVLREEKTLNEIASANNINPKNLQNWTRCPLRVRSYFLKMCCERSEGILLGCRGCYGAS